MHKYHYGYLGRDVWAAYCECGWTHKQYIKFNAFDAKRMLFVTFIEHLEPTAVEDDRDEEHWS